MSRVALNNLASLYQVLSRTADGKRRSPEAERSYASRSRCCRPRIAGQLMLAEQTLDDALNAVQRGTQSSAAAAVNKLAVRLAAGTDRLAQLVRRDQDLKAIVAAVSRESSKRDATAEQAQQGPDFRRTGAPAENLLQRISWLRRGSRPDYF